MKVDLTEVVSANKKRHKTICFARKSGENLPDEKHSQASQRPPRGAGVFDLFLFFVFVTDLRYLKGYPVSLFLELDPLVAFATAIF